MMKPFVPVATTMKAVAPGTAAIIRRPLAGRWTRSLVEGLTHTVCTRLRLTVHACACGISRIPHKIKSCASPGENPDIEKRILVSIKSGVDLARPHCVEGYVSSPDSQLCYGNVAQEESTRTGRLQARTIAMNLGIDEIHFRKIVDTDRQLLKGATFDNEPA